MPETGDDKEKLSTTSNEAFVRDLIEAVRKEEIIYKPGHKFFRHLIKKHQAYLAVANALSALGYKDITAERVKQKWNTVKTMYYRHKPNCANPCTSKNAEAGYQFCNKLEFLGDVEYKNRTCKGCGRSLFKKSSNVNRHYLRHMDNAHKAVLMAASVKNEYSFENTNNHVVLKCSSSENGNNANSSVKNIPASTAVCTRRSSRLDNETNVDDFFVIEKMDNKGVLQEFQVNWSTRPVRRPSSFYRNRKTNSKEETSSTTSFQDNGAMATVSVNETQDGMDRLYELLNTAESAHNHSDKVSEDDLNEDSMMNGEEPKSRNKRSHDWLLMDEQLQAKKLELMDLKLENQRILNKKAKHEARLAEYEADIVEVKLKRIMEGNL
ncbi:unnamed protein product [Bursaphelenchus okinawaensis]|uniref:MADF domain-containing protein n=1 Tax=Bursaphelenchus okinawaensis TaxID=465554 RepID=A0A811LC09_9BILA|nr:unnamed protein product [Bursaphelenchus okinawaensis]CAG9120423.1 unnamed protein product [Bursaphelenchus okinawaensis]